MPNIYLKPNSAEYADEKKQLRTHACDMPGCSEVADFKAPKDRGLNENEYYRFCLNHIQEYNKAWDFFSGMAQVDIEDHIVNSGLWDRPTWRYDSFTNLESDLRNRTWQSYHFTDKKPEEPGNNQTQFEQNTPEHEAMAIMGLAPPLDLKNIKARYKELVKKHHPDVNRDNPQSEELLKAINMAYTILKLAFEKYDKLEK